ncbi:MAG: hypothetical protein ABIX01_11100 [Chitinophagaceae bacterium]
MKTFLFSAALLLLISCGQQAGTDVKTSGASEKKGAAIDLHRANPKPAAVQQYEEKVDNDLNSWFFRVKLFETDKRFTYRVSLSFEEVSGEDEITFPNLGMDPQPVIKKGIAQNECIIGFLDQEGAFREYKKVHVVDGNLKITTLKSYSTSVK